MSKENVYPCPACLGGILVKSATQFCYTCNNTGKVVTQPYKEG